MSNIILCYIIDNNLLLTYPIIDKSSILSYKNILINMTNLFLLLTILFNIIKYCKISKLLKIINGIF